MGYDRLVHASLYTLVSLAIPKTTWHARFARKRHEHITAGIHWWSATQTGVPSDHMCWHERYSVAQYARPCALCGKSEATTSKRKRSHCWIVHLLLSYISTSRTSPHIKASLLLYFAHLSSISKCLPRNPDRGDWVRSNLCCIENRPITLKNGSIVEFRPRNNPCNIS